MTSQPIFKMFSLSLAVLGLLANISSTHAWVHRKSFFVLAPPSLLTLPIAGILHNLSDLERMLSYVTKGRAGTASHQYNDYLLLANDSFSSSSYAMSTPVATLTSRASFEADATAAYQNALVRHFEHAIS
jgi:hypothetical protein